MEHVRLECGGPVGHSAVQRPEKANAASPGARHIDPLPVRLIEWIRVRPVQAADGQSATELLETLQLAKGAGIARDIAGKRKYNMRSIPLYPAHERMNR